MTKRSLPGLMTQRMIQEETGLSASTARTVMQKLPKVYPAGVRRVFVRRSDVYRALGLGEDAA